MIMTKFPSHRINKSVCRRLVKEQRTNTHRIPRSIRSVDSDSEIGIGSFVPNRAYRFCRQRILLILVLLIQANLCWAQGFGKNKITGQRFDWHIHRTEHFDIHYYPSEAKLVPIMADIAEDAYEKHSEDFEHELENRTPLILYKSHKDFQETNIILQELHEGIGGFAELFKHRVVIPFTGSLEAFREVIFHELIHVFQYDIIYQKPHMRIYSGEFLYSPPVWFIEGMADYFAEDNDAIGEMVLRDASINNAIVPLPQLQNFNRLRSPYVGYKMGQLAVAYLCETYGREKVAEIMHGLRESRTKDLDRVFKEVLGVTLADFDKAWRQKVRKRYWPLIQDLELPELLAKNLTEKSRYSHNIKPVWAPSGDIIAYVTGNDGFLEIVLVSAKTGERIERLTKRFFRSKYEDIRTDFNGFGRSIAWAPDGDRIAFIAKHHDANYLLEINILTTELTHYYKLDFDNVTSPDYDGQGKRIVFSGLSEARTDLYIIELSTGDVTPLTSDVFHDTHPSWHPTRDEIVYASERGGRNRLVQIETVADKLMPIATSPRLLTDGTFNAMSPTWTPDGESIIFCADIQGVYDVHKIQPLANSENAPQNGKTGWRLTRLTNMMTGCFNASLSPDGRMLLFSAYQNGKYDVYLMETAKIVEEEVDLRPDAVLQSEEVEPSPLHWYEKTADERNYRIAKRKYSTKSSFVLDAIFPNFSMGADGLLRSTVQIIGSDMLGNHRFGVTVMNQSSYLAPDFIAQYGLLTHRPDIGISVYNYHEYHILGRIQSRRGVLQRITGIGGYLSYPYDRYHRLDIGVSMQTMPFLFNFQTSRPLDPYDNRGLLSLGSIAFIGDTTMWREFYPYTGSRYRFEVERAFTSVGSELSFTNVVLDARRYFSLGHRSTVALRLLLGGSFGMDKDLFYLGGIDTLRGYNYEELIGSRIGLLNAEVRIPFIDILHFGWPVQWTLGGIRGILFADIGGAWSDWEYGPENPFRIFARKTGNTYRFRLDDVKASIGLGLRLQIGLFSIDFAAARNTDLIELEPGFKYHLGLGQAF